MSLARLCIYLRYFYWGWKVNDTDSNNHRSSRKAHNMALERILSAKIAYFSATVHSLEVHVHLSLSCYRNEGTLPVGIVFLVMEVDNNDL